MKFEWLAVATLARIQDLLGVLALIALRITGVPDRGGGTTNRSGGLVVVADWCDNYLASVGATS